jgi:anti-anti-sigma regulatory factor
LLCDEGDGPPMTCRIERTVQPDATVFLVSGTMDAAHTLQLEELLRHEGEKRVLIDLRDTTLVDRDAIRFLARMAASGLELLNCPGYVRRSIAAANNEPW